MVGKGVYKTPFSIFGAEIFLTDFQRLARFSEFFLRFFCELFGGLIQDGVCLQYQNETT